LLVLAPGRARADKVADLIALLERKPDGMDRDTWKEKRRDAARQLGKLGDKRAVPALIRVVEMEQFDVVGEIAIDALGQLGDSRAAPALRAVIDDPSRDRYVREAAQRALKKVGGGGGGGGVAGGGGTAGGGGGAAGGGVAAGGGGTTPGSGSGSGSGSESESGSGSDLLEGEQEAEPPPAAPTFDDDVLGAVDRITFALGGASVEYDTIRDEPTLNGDVALSYERIRDRDRSETRLTITGSAVAGVTDYNGPGESRRYALMVANAVGEGRLYLEGAPVYGLAAANLGGSVEGIKINLMGVDNDFSEFFFGLDAGLAIGGGFGRVLEIGEAIRVRRLEAMLRRARALGRPITPDLAERLLATWWALRGEQGAHRRLTATVALLREAGVLLAEPDASLTYQILQILLDGQLARRPSGLDIQFGVAEAYLVREDTLPVEDGRIESVFANARFGRQSDTGEHEVVLDATARYRILPEEGDPPDPTPWAVLGEAHWRNYFYNTWSDPIGALDIGAEAGASTDGFEMSEAVSRVGGSIGWLFAPNRASQLRLASEGRWESGEVFIGATFEARYGFLDAVYVGSGAYPGQ
jgi:hypothetical protein